MIPLRVTMSGWMRYRERQTADFSGARLLAICGENGAGKSSIFDAITYALFGIHRLGSQNIDELVSEGLGQCMVEFEFEAHGRRYRVRRSRNRRPSPGSQGLWAWDDAVDDWVAITGTDRVAGLNRTLAGLVRVSADAFNASFLLQQGAATAFLDADPAPRFKVISSLVNLEAYEVLEAKARAAQRVAAAEVEDKNSKLAGFDGVDAESLTLLRTRLAQAVEQRDAAVRERDDANALREAAREHARLLRESDETKRQLEGAAELLGEAAQIEANARRHAALDGEIATVGQVLEELEAAAAQDAVAEVARERRAAIDVQALTAALSSAESDAAGAAALVERLVGEERAAAQRERAASEFLTLARQVESLRRRLAEEGERLAASARELERLPALEERTRELRALGAALPALQQYGKERQAAERIGRTDPRAALDAEAQELDALVAGRDAAQRAAEEATEAANGAHRHAATVEAEAESLAAQLAQRRDAATEARCSRCGQPIDPDQARRELAALEERTADAQRRAAAAREEAARLDVDARQAARRREEHEDTIRRADKRRTDLEGQVRDLEEALARAAEARAGFIEAAPDSLRALVPDSLPLVRLHEIYSEQKAVAAGVAEAEAELNDLRRLEGERRTAEAQIDRLRVELTEAEAQAGDRLADLPGAAEAHADAGRRLLGLQQELERARLGERAARTAESAARDALAAAREENDTRERELADAERSAAGHRRTATQLAARLDRELRDRALAGPRAALDLLERERERLADAPARLEQLTVARQQHSRFEGALEAITRELDRIPPERRVAEEVAREAAEAAERRLRETEDRREQCERDVRRMEIDLESVESLRAELAVAETRAERLKKLVALLGKTGLQAALVGEALETVTSHANAFLVRLTGGSLRLELERGDGDALDLKAVDATCMREPRSVQVLSGSQKFRCAVALASGIGQYAGAGGMRSIVIDEGFGSLDRDGQQLIIEELKNLADHMDRVIVVSHLDAFADRVNFPDQLRIVRDGEASRIERVL